MAIPLSLVGRLEEFPRSARERMGARNVIQYRGEILRLISVARALDRMNPAFKLHRKRRLRHRRPAADRPLPVIVCVVGPPELGAAA